MDSALRHSIKFATAILLAAGLPSIAAAGDVSWSVTISSPRPAPVYVSAPPVVYVQPQPVYVQPQPVYVQPQTVYVTPRPVLVQPQPVYVQPGTVVHVGTPVHVYEQPHRKGRHSHWKHRHDYRY